MRNLNLIYWQVCSFFYHCQNVWGFLFTDYSLKKIALKTGNHCDNVLISENEEFKHKTFCDMYRQYYFRQHQRKYIGWIRSFARQAILSDCKGQFATTRLPSVYREIQISTHTNQPTLALMFIGSKYFPYFISCNLA